MKVLSVRQPWADLIVIGWKDIENRSRATHYRGPLLIHASQTVDTGARAALLEELAADGDEESLAYFGGDPVIGAIVGIVNLTDCVTESKSEWFEGPYGYILEDSLPFDQAIDVKGKLGIWDLPAELEEEVKEAIEYARILDEETE